MKKRLPIGLDNFEKIILNDFYFVDKTMFIKDLLNNWSEVNLFTRPRRFGKTLNMTMLKAFFDIQGNPSLFKGLSIEKEAEICERYQCKFPVIYLSLKSIDGPDFKTSMNALRWEIGELALKFSFLGQSENLSAIEKDQFNSLVQLIKNGSAVSDDIVLSSLKVLSKLLYVHYQKSVIVLIDEYDVPLDKAFNNGYYDQMIYVIRNLFGNVLKSNEYLKFAVITGCLRISKESIFTGLNNIKVHSISDVRYDEHFGFTTQDVQALLTNFGLNDYFDQIKHWYDGYRFGNINVYCPWDVINYCDELLHDPLTVPKNYWANTSSNALVLRLLKTSGETVRDDVEKLISGEAIFKKVKEELTYADLESASDNIWSVLYSTGYLTLTESLSLEQNGLRIPNEEIRNIFIDQIVSWFDEETKKEHRQVDKLCRALLGCDISKIEEILQYFLWKSISVRDGAVRHELKENFYHGWLLGLLSSHENWKVRSNRETGAGYSDIVVFTPQHIALIIELKYAHNGDLADTCQKALNQINDKHYGGDFDLMGITTVYHYGISFYAKNCCVMMQRQA